MLCPRAARWKLTSASARSSGAGDRVRGQVRPTEAASAGPIPVPALFATWTVLAWVVPRASDPHAASDTSEAKRRRIIDTS